MELKSIRPEDVIRRSISALGFDPDCADFTLPETVAEMVRRIVSTRGPVTRATVVRLVVDPLRGLTGFDSTIDDLTSDVIDELLSLGDLVENEIARASGAGASLLFIAMPRFVVISSQLIVLLGCRPDGVPLLGDHLAGYLEWAGCARYLRLPNGLDNDVRPQLRDEGIREIKNEHWLRAPHPEPAESYLQRFSSRLDAAHRSGELDGALVFDPSTDRRYYRGRWQPLRRPADGLILLRRPQAYGSDRWSIARVENGHVQGLIDLPGDSGGDRACDVAWRVMAALDAIRGAPPLIRTTQLTHGRVRLDFDAPPPAWLQRHLTFFGAPAPRARGSLFSFSVDEQAVGHLRELTEQRLWPSWTEEAANQQ